MRRKRYDEVATKNPLRGPCSVVYHDVADSPAFKAMRPHAKLAVVMVKRSYNRTTQKAVPVSARVIAKLTGVSNNKGLSLMKEAMHYGFWRLHTAGRLGVDGKGIATFVPPHRRAVQRRSRNARFPEMGRHAISRTETAVVL